MGLVGGRLPVEGPLAGVLDRQGGGDDHDLVETAVRFGLEDHAPEPGVERQLGQAAAERRQALLRVLLRRVEGTELLQEGDAVLDAAGVGGVDEREAGDVAEAEGGHLEDDRRQVGADDLRFGELRPGAEVGLGVEPDAHAGGDPAAAAGPLVGRRLRHRFDRQALHLGPVRVPGDAGRAGVDHRQDARHRQRRLGHVGGQHDPPAGVGLEDPVLVGGGQAGVERQELRVGKGQGGEGLGGVADLPFTGEEHEDVARPAGHQLGHGVGDALDLVALLGGAVTVAVGGSIDVDQRPVADLDRVGTARHLHDRRPAEVAGEALGVDRGRRDDHLEVGPAGEQLLEVAEDEIDVEAPLVGLVDDDRVVGREQAVALDLGQEDAVGHHLDQRVVTDPVGEADGVADHAADLAPELLCHPFGHRPGGQAAGLRVADHAPHAPADLEADLGQLRALPRAGLAGHDHHRVGGDGGGDVVPALADGQRGGVTGRRHPGPAVGHPPLGRLHGGGDLVEERLPGGAVLEAPGPVEPAPEPVLVPGHEGRQAGGECGKGRRRCQRDRPSSLGGGHDRRLRSGAWGDGRWRRWWRWWAGCC